MAPLNRVYLVLRWQVRLGLAVCVLAALLDGGLALVSALCGFVIGVLPSALYVILAYRVRFAPPSALLRAHFAAEIFKFLATLLLFAAVFIVFKQVVVVYLFAAFIATLAAYWVVLIIKE
jgi:ATP synthase protein I